VAVLAACIVLLLGAGVVGALTVDPDENAGGTTPVDAGALSPAIEPAPVAPPIDLATVVVGGPPGFDQIPDARLLVGGDADVERLAAERSNKDHSKRVFAETGLISGFVRAWQRPSTSELVTVRLYQFKNAEGAKGYADTVITAMSAAPASTFNVPATTDTVGIDTQMAQGANRVAYVVSRRGRVVAAIAATVVPPPDAGFLAPFARSQLSLLPAT
jgi:hypothetical protein